MNYTYFFIVFLALFVYNGFTKNLLAQDSCDPALSKLSNGPLGYQNRGDRCEGIYIKEVGSTTLQIASFTETFENYDLNSSKPLLIEWKKLPQENNFHIRANGIRRKLYYRMDASPHNNDTIFNWPTAILSSLNINKNDIGVTGSFSYKTKNSDKEVYVPLQISQKEKFVSPGNYNVILLPGVELSEVYISLALVNSETNKKKYIKDGEALGYGFYPAERGINIPVNGLKEHGIYSLEVGATLRNGGTSALEIWFYY